MFASAFYRDSHSSREHSWYCYLRYSNVDDAPPGIASAFLQLHTSTFVCVILTGYKNKIVFISKSKRCDTFVKESAAITVAT